MVEHGSLWETLHRYVAPDYVVACVQVSQALHTTQSSYPGACIPICTAVVLGAFF